MEEELEKEYLSRLAFALAAQSCSEKFLGKGREAFLGCMSKKVPEIRRDLDKWWEERPKEEKEKILWDYKVWGRW